MFCLSSSLVNSKRSKNHDPNTKYRQERSQKQVDFCPPSNDQKPKDLPLKHTEKTGQGNEWKRRLQTRTRSRSRDRTNLSARTADLDRRMAPKEPPSSRRHPRNLSLSPPSLQNQSNEPHSKMKNTIIRFRFCSILTYQNLLWKIQQHLSSFLFLM